MRSYPRPLTDYVLAGACGGCKFAEHVWNTVTGELSQANDMFVKPFISTTVISWSIHAGTGADGTYDLARIAAEIKRVGPDVALLQDVDRKTRRAHGVRPSSPRGQGPLTEVSNGATPSC